MAGKVFINYRRGDAADSTGRLYDRLELDFPPGDLFMDVEGHIRPGDDFVEVLNRQVAQCDVLLAIIGPRWAELLARRQDDKDDFVAIEIAAALAQGKRVIPVLVGGAGIPRADTLPEGIRALARRNAVGLRPERFKADCQGLVAALKESLAAAEQERAARTETERRAAEAARREAEAQAAARAQVAEERGRAQAAAGLSAEEIRKAEELASWQFVEGRRDIGELRDHLARYPGGVTERFALVRLEELVWAGLGAEPGREALQAFLDEFPKGASAEAAESRLSKLQAEAKVAEERTKREAAEAAAWSVLRGTSDKAAVETFLKEWPNGEHAGAARSLLRELSRGQGLSSGAWLGIAAVGALGLIGLVTLSGGLSTQSPNLSEPRTQSPSSESAACNALRDDWTTFRDAPVSQAFKNHLINGFLKVSKSKLRDNACIDADEYWQWTHLSWEKRKKLINDCGWVFGVAPDPVTRDNVDATIAKDRQAFEVEKAEICELERDQTKSKVKTKK